MATHYQIIVETLSKYTENHEDTVDNNIRDEIAWFEQSDQFKLGPRVGTKKGDDWDEHGGTRYYYYHNGRITVRTMYNQLTPSQRQGRRRF
jgi:hypothetical protein